MSAQKIFLVAGLFLSYCGEKNGGDEDAREDFNNFYFYIEINSSHLNSTCIGTFISGEYEIHNYMGREIKICSLSVNAFQETDGGRTRTMCLALFENEVSENIYPRGMSQEQFRYDVNYIEFQNCTIDYYLPDCGDLTLEIRWVFSNDDCAVDTVQSAAASTSFMCTRATDCYWPEELLRPEEDAASPSDAAEDLDVPSGS